MDLSDVSRLSLSPFVSVLLNVVSSSCCSISVSIVLATAVRCERAPLLGSAVGMTTIITVKLFIPIHNFTLSQFGITSFPASCDPTLKSSKIILKPTRI